MVSNPAPTDPTPFCALTIAGSTPVSCVKYTFNDQPILKDKIGEVGRQQKLVATCYVEADDTADIGSVLATAGGGTISGRDVVITGLGGVPLVEILAVYCTEGGPWIEVYLDTETDTGGLHHSIRITADAKTAPAGNNNPSNNGSGAVVSISTKQKTQVKDNGLITITAEGELTSPTAEFDFLNLILPTFQKQYPVGQWVITYDYTNGDTAKVSAATGLAVAVPSSFSTLNYTVDVVQLAVALPKGNGATVVDGEVTKVTSRDEQFRLKTVWRFDLVLSATGAIDAPTFAAALMPVAANLIRSQSVSLSTTREPRLLAEFEVIAGGDGDDLLNYSERLKVVSVQTTWEERNYEGADPIIVQKPTLFARMTQSGSATGYTRFPIAPSPLGEYLTALPEVDYDARSKWEFTTSWSYQMVVPTAGNSSSGSSAGSAISSGAQSGSGGQTLAPGSTALLNLLSSLTRPASPTFYGPSGSGDGGKT